MGRRAWVMGVAAALTATLVACGTTPTSPPSSTPSSTPSSASPTPTPVDLTDSGRAREAVTALLARADGFPVVRVSIDEDVAALTWVDTDHQVHTAQWSDGVISDADSDVAWVEQRSFDPTAYAFDDLAGLFRQAAEVSGSSARQELQINEVNPRSVLMTVTTQPESAPVFFRPDGSLVRTLDFTVTADLAEGLSDALDGRTNVYTIGFQPDVGLWVDLPAGAGVIERRTRPSRVPAFPAFRSTVTTPRNFSAGTVDPTVLTRIMADVAAAQGTPGASLAFTIQRGGDGPPTIQWDGPTRDVETTLTGEPVETSGG